MRYGRHIRHRRHTRHERHGTDVAEFMEQQSAANQPQPQQPDTEKEGDT